jgi:autotransporter-associated beta strand protein
MKKTFPFFRYKKSLDGESRSLGRGRKAGLELETLENRTLPSFALSGTFATGAEPGSIAVGDFRGDGLTDLAVVNRGSSTVSVLLGNGDATFQAAQNYPVGVLPEAIAVADINGDSKPDLIVVNLVSQSVSILLGNGDGTFQGAQNFSLGTYKPYALAVADLNGDGKPDLVTLGRYGGLNSVLSVLLNTSSGSTVSFGTPSNIPLNFYDRFSLIAADLNLDGKPDLVVSTIQFGSTPNQVSVLLGNGDGTFQAPQNFVLPYTPRVVGAADLNGDGIPDLVTVNESSNNVTVLLGSSSNRGKSTLTFQPAKSYPAGLLPVAIAVADVNSIGIPSLVVTNENINSVSVLFGPGDGSFLPPQSIQVGAKRPYGLAVADLNGDGQPDVITANYFSNSISVLVNISAPPFQPVRAFPSGFYPRFVAVADVNGDGLGDVVTANYFQSSVNVLLSNGDGTLQDAQALGAYPGPNSVAVADINGDGHQDLIVSTYTDSRIGILTGNGDGTFRFDTNLTVPFHPRSVTASDLNGDGSPDLIVADGTVISVFLNNGSGTLSPVQNFAAGGTAYQVAVADVNGDGIPDVVVDTPYALYLLPGNGNGTFQAPVPIFSVSATSSNKLSSLAVADFRGNGMKDVAVTQPNLNTVSVLLGNGNGTFGSARSISAGFDPVFVATGEVEGDSRPDMVVADEKGDSVTILSGNGDGTFRNPQTINAGPIPYAVAVGALTGDGKSDIVVANATISSVGVLLHTTTSQLQISSPTLTVSGTSLFVTVTAMDSSGRVDPRYTGTVTFISTDPKFGSPSPYTFTLADQGRHTFQFVLKTAGLQSITVDDGVLSATSRTLVKPAPASRLFFPQPPLDSIIGTPIPELTVQLLDQSGNVSTSNASVSLTIASGPGSFTSTSATTVAAANGLAIFSNVGFTAAGTYTLTAFSAGLGTVTSGSFQISVTSLRTWSGKGPDNLWSDAANWLENVPPIAGNDLFFPDGALQISTSTDNFAPGFAINSINFTGVSGGYDLLGNSISLTAGLTANAGIDKVDLAGIALGANQTWNASDSTVTVSSPINLTGLRLIVDGLQAPTGIDSLTGVISGAGETAGAIIKNGPSDWLVSGTNTFTGPVTINNGTLAVNNSTSLGAVANAVTVNPGSAGTGSLQVFNNISVLQPLTINGNGNNLSPGAIDIRDTTLNDTFGAISLGSAASIVSANIGVNTMTLTGAIQNNGFDLSIVGAGGYTTVLSNTATVSGTGHVLNFGSIFSGTGTLNSALNVNQGTLSPGSGGNPGTLNSSDVNFGIGTNYNPILGNTSNSLLNSAGSVNLSGSNLSLSFQSGFVPNPGQSYVIITAAGSINGTFNGLPDGAPIIVNGQQFLIRYLNSSASNLHPSAINGRTVIFPVPASTTTSLFASSNPVVAGQPETFTAIVTSPAAAVAGVSSSVITGTVNFFDGGGIIGSGQVTGGAAVFTTTGLGPGNHSITATYTGSPTFSASNTNASPIALTVNNGSVGWQDVMTGSFTAGKDSDIAGMTAGGSWWVAVSNGSKFSNQFWGTWPVATWVDVQTGDFNGDGLTDIAGRNSQTGQWYVAQSTGSSFNTTIWTTWNPNVTWVDVKVGDFNGDGKSDISGRFLQTGQWFVAQSTGSSFTSSLWGTWNPNVTWVDVKVGDFAGNKTADITGRWLQGGSWWTAVSNGSSFTTSLWAQWNPNVTWVDVQVGDFNGDRKADITARYAQTGQWWTAVSTGSSFNTSLWATWNPNLDWVDVKVGDFNGDGKADITARWLDTGEWFTGVSTGSAFLTSLWNTWSPAVTWVDVNVGDVNGDGVPDLVGRIQQNGQWWAALSNGSTAFTNQLWTTWAV